MWLTTPGPLVRIRPVTIAPTAAHGVEPWIIDKRCSF
jgi:hypothetical protein